jgi:hypothetical protein
MNGKISTCLTSSSRGAARLREVTGIDPKRAERIITGWAEQAPTSLAYFSSTTRWSLARAEPDAPRNIHPRRMRRAECREQQRSGAHDEVVPAETVVRKSTGRLSSDPLFGEWKTT